MKPRTPMHRYGKNNPHARLEVMRQEHETSAYKDQVRLKARTLCEISKMECPAWAAKRGRFMRRLPVPTAPTAAVLEVPAELPEALSAWRARTRGSCVHVSRTRGVILDVLGGESRTFTTIDLAVKAVTP